MFAVRVDVCIICMCALYALEWIERKQLFYDAWIGPLEAVQYLRFIAVSGESLSAFVYCVHVIAVSWNVASFHAL